MTTTTKPKLNRLPDINGLERHEVTVEGEVIGVVEQHIATRVVAYSGKTYGRPVSRKCWQWNDTTNAGDFELPSRAAAVRGLVEFASRNA
jgi:hypothetical protein